LHRKERFSELRAGRPTLVQGSKSLVLADSERLGSEGGSPKQPHKVKERSHG